MSWKFYTLIVLLIITSTSIIFYQIIFNKYGFIRTYTDKQLIDLYANRHDYKLLLRQLNASNIKSIQLYTKFYSWPHWRQSGLGSKPFENCPVYTSCYAFRMSDKHGQKALEQSDGVLVHIPNLIQLPSRNDFKRRPN